MLENKKGLAKALEIYSDRRGHAIELKKNGERIIGFPCPYVPVEMITAAGLVPYRVYGCIKEPITEADRSLPAAICPIVRSCFDCALKGQTDFFDGMSVVHCCDAQDKAMRMWGSYVKYNFWHVLDMPGTLRSESYDYHIKNLQDFKITLENYSGNKLTDAALADAIKVHNEQRSLIRNLYDMTKPELPLITGTEVLMVIKAVMSMEVREGNQLLKEVIDEVKERKQKPLKKSARLMIWSSTLDHIEIMQVFEDNANVVLDESCGGIRPFRANIKMEGNPLDDIARYYMREITCAKQFRQNEIGETKLDYKKDLQSRFGYLEKMVKDWKVDGVILFLVRYCDPFAFEVPAVKDYLGSLNIPSMYIEYDYTEGSLAPMKTRVEGFIETLS